MLSEPGRTLQSHSLRVRIVLVRTVRDCQTWCRAVADIMRSVSLSVRRTLRSRGRATCSALGKKSGVPYAVETAPNAHQALSLLDSHPFDTAVIDVGQDRAILSRWLKR